MFRSSGTCAFGTAGTGADAAFPVKDTGRTTPLVLGARLSAFPRALCPSNTGWARHLPSALFVLSQSTALVLYISYTLSPAGAAAERDVPLSSMRVQDCLFVLSVCGVTILNIFVNGALIIALPTIGKALDFSEADLQWPLNVYALSYGSLLLLCGRIADVVGAKRMFLFGTGFFTIWSIATGVAPNKVSLIVFVALTGVGAAANTPTGMHCQMDWRDELLGTSERLPTGDYRVRDSFMSETDYASSAILILIEFTGISIFANHFESGPTKNRAIAALGAGQAVGYIVGLVGGGFLCQSEKLWPVIFYIQGGLAAVFFVLGVITIPSDVHHKRYTKGIDWVGAVLSVGGVGLLTFVLSVRPHPNIEAHNLVRESTTVSRGWKTPWVPALLVVSLLILAAFVLWEWYRERHDKSVIMPVSLWTKPGTKMAPTIAVVFLAWCVVRGDDPAQTSFETIPFAIMAFLANVIAGALLGILRGDVLIGLGLLGTMAAPLILALIDERASYWKMAFWMFNVSWTDVAYTVGNLQISISFPPSSQGLAGGIFNVATRLGTSLGLALTSSVSAAVSARYNARHPELARDAVPVVMAGVRAGAWVTFGLAAAAFAVCVLCLRGIGVIGLKMHEDAESESSDAGLGGAGDVEGIAELGAASDKTGTLAEVLPSASQEKV
ncbi:hypothetical protein ACG7TL_008558 [Trametes sanguinea]